MGRRIFKKVYSGEILKKHLSFVYDGYKLIEERNALDNNAAVRKYVWQPEALDRDVPLTVYDAASEKTYYYHTDANKNVTELSDESGNVVAHYEYSPFGSLTKVTGDYAANNPFRFSSEYFDEETGLVYYNYRYYNPELGRWISRDPIEEQGGYNLYGMIGNNPLYGWDYLGMEYCSRCANLTWNEKLALYLQTQVNNLADNLAGNNYYTDIGIYLGAELLNGALDTLNFGRDIADAIYNNDGDWLDKGAAMSPDLLRGANILMSAAGILKATSPNVKAPGTPNSNLLPDEAWHKNAPKQVTPGTNEISHTKYNPKTGTLEKSNVKYDNYGRQIERVDYSDHGYPQNHTNPHTHHYEYNQTYPKGREIK